MIRAAVLGAGLALGIGVGSAAGAQQAAPGGPLAPTPDDVRAAFEADARGRPPVPALAREALVAGLDRRFHARPSGRSAITRMATNWFPEPTGARRGLEGFWARTVIGQAPTHGEILDWVAREVFLGRGCFGVVEAARAYLGMAAADMGAGQAAFLAAIARAPSVFDPDRARERRDLVLGEMERTGALSPGAVAAARARPLGAVEPPGRCD